jgi:hypothetical protein
VAIVDEILIGVDLQKGILSIVRPLMEDAQPIVHRVRGNAAVDKLNADDDFAEHDSEPWRQVVPVDLVSSMPAPSQSLALPIGDGSMSAGTHVKDAEGDESAELELHEALEQSEHDALLREQEDTALALLRSKADGLSADGVILARLTFHCPMIIGALLELEPLRVCIDRVESTGCEVRPVWANGAILLVPTTEGFILEAGICLKAHNILMLDSDKDRIYQGLSGLPRRWRPQLKPEHHAQRDHDQNAEPPTFSPSEASKAPSVGDATASRSDMPELSMEQTWSHCFVVERTFLNFRFAKDVSELSDVVQSAPACIEPFSDHTKNPRRWRLTPGDDEMHATLQ